MSLELVFLGTGTSTGVPMIGCRCGVCTSDDPHDRRTRASVLVRYPRPADAPPPRRLSEGGRALLGTAGSASSSADPAHGRTHPPEQVQVLVDVTPDLRNQALREGLDWLDAVVLTHAHADHTMGIDDLRRFNAIMDAPLDVYAEHSVHEQLGQSFGYIFNPSRHGKESFIANLIPFPVRVEEPLNLHDATWTPIRLMHGRLPIVGYRVDWGGRSIAYCTDVSTIPPETWPMLEGLDVFVIDGLRYRHHPTHMTIDRAIEVCEQVGATQSYLTHMSHDVSHASQSQAMPAGVSLAHDGLCVSVAAEGALTVRA
ncbi:MAG: MBL fold metallo-hydrolase [Phycisphaerales bacterium JB063]